MKWQYRKFLRTAWLFTTTTFAIQHKIQLLLIHYTASFLLYHLSRNSDAQDKLLAECESIGGDTTDLTRKMRLLFLILFGWATSTELE